MRTPETRPEDLVPQVLVQPSRRREKILQLAHGAVGPKLLEQALQQGPLVVMRELSGRYDAFTAAERLRTLAWLCGWQRLSDDYEEVGTQVSNSSRCTSPPPRTLAIHACPIEPIGCHDH